MKTKTLQEVLGDGANAAMAGADTPVTGVAYRSDAVEPGNVFFCISGFRHDGHDFASDALARGATAVVCERSIGVSVSEVIVSDTRRALAMAAARFYDDPTSALDVVGITGTNGKTTTTYLVDSIARAAGKVTGLVGTVETRVAGKRSASGRTTPESADIQRLFSEMRDAGVSVASIEVSSHAIDLHRVDAVHFAVAAFTNLTQDHLDYHHTIEEYWSVKRRLFTDLDVRTAVVNIDDPRGAELAGGLTHCVTVGRSESALVRAVDEAAGPGETTFTLALPDATARLTLPLAGPYNVSNALVAAGSALGLGIGIERIVEGLETAPQVPGRLERVDAGQPFTVLVDYAHTPDSLAKAIEAVRGVTPGRVITIFGCGGDRDPDKRPLMGRAAGERADLVIVTSDNPRSEDPVGIILEIEDGLAPTGVEYEIEIDRRSAIARALSIALPGDAVLIAGKGHEDYQIFSDHTIHFDDREVAREELSARC